MQFLSRAANALLLPIVLLIAAGCSGEASTPPSDTFYLKHDSLWFEGEDHLRNIRQLTFGGNNAEAYFSRDDRQIIFQSDWDEINSQGCDQQFVMNTDGTLREGGSPYQLVSTGSGRTTCGYFLPDGRIVYSSTHAAGPECPAPRPSATGAYAWPVYEAYDIYVAEADGSNPQPLIQSDYYDAEATVSPDGRYIVFTSTRSGDIDVWRYEIETGEYLQLTDEPGYDGGAFFSPDSKKIVWRASRPEGEDLESHRELLEQGLVEPGELNIYVMDADGSNKRQVTDLDGANWAPFFHPDGQRLLFSSNHHKLDGGGREFAIFMVDLDGSNLKQITHSGTFESFPMFSYDGTKLIFSSNRNIEREPSRVTNVFIADWVE